MKTSVFLTPGQVYSRGELREKFGIGDATINTGVFRPKGHDSVWLFVTRLKTPDQPQYQDLLDGDALYWDGQSNGRTDGKIINHTNSGLELIVFYREHKYQYKGSAFRYEGIFRYVSHTGSNPTHFVLKRVLDLDSMAAEDVKGYDVEQFIEVGLREKRYVNYFERNPQIRAAVIRAHGTKCMACGFDFERTYGERGRGYIEAHHIVPVSQLDGETIIDPVTDMVVLCANCHRMVHRRKDDVLSLDDLQCIVAQYSSAPEDQ